MLSILCCILLPQQLNTCSNIATGYLRKKANYLTLNLFFLFSIFFYFVLYFLFPFFSIFVFYLNSLIFRLFEPKEFIFADVWWWPAFLGWDAAQSTSCYYFLSLVYRFSHLPGVSIVTLTKVSLNISNNFIEMDHKYILRRWVGRELQNREY